jgi:phage terminase large subunit-like protein
MAYRRTLAEARDTARQALARRSPDLMRALCLKDLWFLLVVGCGRKDLDKQWFLDRCDEVQARPDGYLDLWAREHGKSSIITFGKVLQDVLTGPELTVGIFSHTRPMAKAFLRVLKREMESNELLKRLFPDVLWADPQKEAPKWSEDDGLIVKRRGNPKESTIEAWGLVDGMPTGKHFDLLMFDDLVTKDNAASPEMREKVLEAWKFALNLGKRGGRRRLAGTRYHFGDAYGAIIDAGSALPRIYAAERYEWRNKQTGEIYHGALPVTGEESDEDSAIGWEKGQGGPVLLSQAELDAKRRDMGPYVFASQMNLDPRQDSKVGFKLGWLRTYHGDAIGNTYVIVDPANEKKKKSDYTSIFVMTASADQNWYVRWMKRDRLNLIERTNLVFWAHREFQPLVVAYEEYGMQADIEHIRYVQQEEHYRFDVTPLGGKLSKFERISGLAGNFERGQIWLPPTLFVPILERGGEMLDQVHVFVTHEYTAWPYAIHDDMLDCLARINDPALGVKWPRATESNSRYMRVPQRRVSKQMTQWIA